MARNPTVADLLKYVAVGIIVHASSKLTVLFQNDAVVVIDKPAGWLSVPSRKGLDDARPCVGPALEGQLSGRLWPVHRLDLEVSGLLLFARSADAHRKACGWFERRTVHKTYQALTEGPAPLEPEAIWTGVLVKGKKRAFTAPHGKPTETRVQWLGTRADGAQHWELEPVTGRSHQLRFDMARHGYMILGDVLYGSTQGYAGDGIALRAVRLDFHAAESARTLGLPAVLTASPLA